MGDPPHTSAIALLKRFVIHDAPPTYQGDVAVAGGRDLVPDIVVGGQFGGLPWRLQ